ncbi:MAG: nucleotide exchange factor GrpE [Lachnospiraceae bacterium]|nr:nucleotide exchange factor GrpE [Lachnospiraceae bacterium]
MAVEIQDEEELMNTESGEEQEAEEAAAEEKADTSKEEAAAEEPAEEDTADTSDKQSGEASAEEEKAEEPKPDKEKKKKKDKKTDLLQTKIEELEDRVKRQMAEFDNFRKRTEKEKSQMFETGARSVIEKILPVVDNFERGLATVPEDEAGKPFCDGMNMIYKQLIDELDKMDVKPIEAVGCEFDPELHNAVMQVESDEYESGIVAQELQKGYTYRGTVVRHSMVAVVQ